MKKSAWIVSGMFAACGGLAWLAQACSEDDGPAAAASVNASPTTTSPPTSTPVVPPVTVGDAGTDAEAPSKSFVVPAGGGAVDVEGATTKITFAFPASAAGKTFTLETTAATAIGWPADQFVEAIALGPSGARFDDPIKVTIEKKASVGAVFAFPDSPTKSAASPVPFDEATGSFLLSHFTVLVLAPPGKVCDSQGFQDTPCSARCIPGIEAGDGGACRYQDGGAPVTGITTFRQVTCKGYSFCLHVNAACCVDPSAAPSTTCSVENQKYGISFTPTGTNGGSNPHCEPAVTSTWDGGTVSGCSAQNTLNYSFGQGGGCNTNRDCSAQGPFVMNCAGGTCQCTYGGGGPGYPRSFAQGSACDTSATMKKAFAESCGFPVD